MQGRVDDDFTRMMEGYSLTTARILYRMPDHPLILQEYIWQKYDMAPKFPVLKDFLDFWQQKIEGRLHTVFVASAQLIRPAELQMVGSEFRLQ